MGDIQDAVQVGSQLLQEYPQCFMSDPDDECLTVVDTAPTPPSNVVETLFNPQLITQPKRQRLIYHFRVYISPSI